MACLEPSQFLQNYITTFTFSHHKISIFLAHSYASVLFTNDNRNIYGTITTSKLAEITTIQNKKKTGNN